jgi:DNA-binding transcriptional LysR family regulator
VVQEAHSMHAVLSLVAAEAGVSLVPANMARARSGGIVYVPLAEEEAVFDLMLCHRADRIEPATQALLLSLMDDGECDSARLSSAPAKGI